MRYLFLVCAPAALLAQTLTISPATVPPATRGVPYSQSFTATGAAGGYVFSHTGTLPPGLSLEGATLSGTPTSTGNYSFTIHADAGPASGARTYTLSVSSANIILGPASLPPAKVGLAYSQALSASGAPGPFTFALLTGSFPPGITLAGAGTLSGTPTAAGNYSFTLRASDSTGNAGTRSYSLTVAATLTLGPATLPNPVSGAAYAQTLSVSGGVAPYTWTLSGGALPSGLSLGAGGQLTGQATAAGQYAFTVQVTDSAGNDGTRSYNMAVLSPISISPAALPDASLSVLYSQTLAGVGGMSPYSFALTQGSLPSGLALSTAGVLSGTPASAALGTYSFTVTATDFTGRKGEQAFTLKVVPLTLAISPATLPDGAVGQPYTQVLTASGGATPYTFSLLDGPLPDGLTLSLTGVLGGTPRAGGVFALTIRAADTLGRNGYQSYSLFIRSELTLMPPTLPGGVVDVPYETSLAAAGGAAPYTYFVLAGSLPPGLGLNPGGRIAGVPRNAGSSSFTVQAADANGSRTSRPYTIAISADLAFTTVTLPDAKAGVAYQATLAATGGQTPYTFGLDSGTLPAGLSLSSSGLLSGAPSAAGLYSFVLRVTDALGGSRQQGFTLSVAAGTPTVTSLIAEPAALIFRVRAGAAPPGQRCLSVFATSGAREVAASLDPPVAWAAPPAAAATTPANLCVAVQPAGLEPGEYRTSLVVNSTLAVPVILVLEADPDTTVRVLPPAWTVVVPAGSRQVSRSVTLLSGDMAVHAVAFSDATGLAPGVYTRELSVQAAGIAGKLSLTLVVSSAGAVAGPARQTVELRGLAGGANPPAQRIALPYAGNFSSLQVTVEQGADLNWLRFAPSGAGPASLSVWADIRGLAEGSYTGLLKVAPQGATQPPQLIPVNLAVLPSVESPGVPMPALWLAGAAAAQVPLVNLRSESLAWTALPSTLDGAGWLQSTVSGILPAGSPAAVTVAAQPAVTITRPARGSVRFGLADGSTRSLPVVYAEPCAGASGPLLVQTLQPAAGQAFAVGDIVRVAVAVRTCQGTPVDDAGVTLRIGGEVLDLVRTEPGVWAGSWTPAQPGVAQLESWAANSSAAPGRHALDVLVTGEIPDAPFLSAAVHAASYRPVAAPGGWVTLYGARLTGARVRAGDAWAFVSYSGPGQINALLPHSLSSPDLLSLAAHASGRWSAPTALPVQPVAPALFTVNQQGAGQAAALISGTANLAAPAARGQYVEFYGAGFGAVSGSLNQVTSTVTVTIGGVNARVLFAGLAPGFPGLYQVNVQIPATAPTGPAVPVALSVNGIAAPETSIGIQ